MFSTALYIMVSPNPREVPDNDIVNLVTTNFAYIVLSVVLVVDYKLYNCTKYKVQCDVGSVGVGGGGRPAEPRID